MTTRFSFHVFLTINFDAKTLHVCKQQQIASGNKKNFCDTLVSNWLMAVQMTISHGHMCHSPLPLMPQNFNPVNNNK